MHMLYISCTHPEGFVRGGPILTVFFKLMRGERIKIPQKTGHYQPTSQTPFKWHFPGGRILAQHGSYVIFHGIRPSIDKPPYSFEILQGMVPPLDRRMYIKIS